MQIDKDILPKTAKEKLRTKMRVLEFDHNGKKFTVEAFCFPTTDSSKLGISLFIQNAEKEVGKIEGEFSVSPEGKREFHCFNIENLGIFYDDYMGVEKREGHLPNVIQETIIHLILGEIIQIWYTSNQVQYGGSILYEKLLKDPRLQGKKYPVVGFPRDQFVLEKKF